MCVCVCAGQLMQQPMHESESAEESIQGNCCYVKDTLLNLFIFMPNIYNKSHI